jgi:hypothetical protein
VFAGGTAVFQFPALVFREVIKEKGRQSFADRSTITRRNFEMRMKLFFAAVLAGCFLFMASASATVINFGSSTFTGADGQSTFNTNVFGIGVNLSANTGKLDWTAGDGIGIKTFLDPNPDEVQGAERLTIGLSFAQPLMLNSITLSNLYYENGFREEGSYRLNGGAWIQFLADPGQTPGTQGLLSVGVNQLVTSVEFKAPGWDPTWSDPLRSSEFTLQNMDVGPAVPEPATFGLLGTALLGLGLAGYRRRKAQKQ